MDDISIKELRKYRTKSTARFILEYLKDIDVDTILNTLYIYSDNENTEYMLKEFEKQLLLAKLKEDDFKKGLNQFYINMAKYLKKNKLIKEFLVFLYYLNINKFGEKLVLNSSEKNDTNSVYRAYVSLILQQFTYLVVSPNLLAGLTSKNEIISIKEPLPYLDYASLRLMQNKIMVDDFFKELKKCGFGYIKDMEELNKWSTTDTLVTNSIYFTSFLIDETTKHFLPKKHLVAHRGVELPLNPFRDIVNEYLKKRKRFLRGKEATITLNNCAVREVTLKETFFEDNLYVLYKFKTLHSEESLGFYDVSNDVFQSIYFFTNANKYHILIRDLITEIYVICTSDIDLEQTRFKEFDMKIKYKSADKNISNGNGSSLNKRNKELYDKESIYQEEYIRKLPVGAKASEEAINRAKKFGIELNSDETFVKAFVKTIYRTKE